MSQQAAPKKKKKSVVVKSILTRPSTTSSSAYPASAPDASSSSSLDPEIIRPTTTISTSTAPAPVRLLRPSDSIAAWPASSGSAHRPHARTALPLIDPRGEITRDLISLDRSVFQRGNNVFRVVGAVGAAKSGKAAVLGSVLGDGFAHVVGSESDSDPTSSDGSTFFVPRFLKNAESLDVFVHPERRVVLLKAPALSTPSKKSASSSSSSFKSDSAKDLRLIFILMATCDVLFVVRQDNQQHHPTSPHPQGDEETPPLHHPAQQRASEVLHLVRIARQMVLSRKWVPARIVCVRNKVSPLLSSPRRLRADRAGMERALGGAPSHVIHVPLHRSGKPASRLRRSSSETSPEPQEETAEEDPKVVEEVEAEFQEALAAARSLARAALESFDAPSKRLPTQLALSGRSTEGEWLDAFVRLWGETSKHAAFVEAAQGVKTSTRNAKRAQQQQQQSAAAAV